MSGSWTGGNHTPAVPAGFLFLHGSTGIKGTVRTGSFRSGGNVRIPADPGLSNAAGICTASSRFAGVFYGILEFLYADRGDIGRPAACGSSGGLGIRQIPVPGKRCALVLLYAFDDSPVSGDYGFRISGTECGSSDGYTGGSNSAGDVFHIAGIHIKEELFGNSR